MLFRSTLALSIQPNEKRVEGDFLTTIFSNAIPGGLILLMNVYIIKLLSLFGIFATDNLIMTMQVVAFSLGGVVYLYKICKPFNVLRAIILSIVIILMAVWVVWLLDTSATLHISNFFGLTALFPMTMETWEYPLVLFAIIELNLLIVEPLCNLNKSIISSLRKDKN